MAAKQIAVIRVDSQAFARAGCVEDKSTAKKKAQGKACQGCRAD
jgi:hypothetical protein